MAIISGISSNFDLDTQSPQGLSVFTAASPNSTVIECAFSVVTDVNFSHFEIWYGENESDVQNKTGTALVWDDGDDANLTNPFIGSTDITVVTPGTTYYMSIFAFDDYGNETVRVDTAAPVTVYIQAQTELDGEILVYDVVTTHSDAFVKVFEENPNHYFGLILIYDDAETYSDGSVHIGHDFTNHADGQLSINELIIRLLDGFIYVVDTVQIDYDGQVSVVGDGLTRFDGLTIVFTDTIAQFDGSIEVEMKIHFNGQVAVVKVVTDSFDGLMMVANARTEYFSGLLSIGFVVSFDAKLNLRDPYSPFLRDVVPIQGSTLIPVDSTITFTIADNESGVNLDTVRLSLIVDKEEILVFDGSNPRSYPFVAYSGDLSAYHFSFGPSVLNNSMNFPYEKKLYIKVRVEDFGGNEFGTIYFLTTARNPILRATEGAIVWETEEHFKFNLEYGTNVPQRTNLVVQNDRLCLAD